ncbi:hypothetical protein [Vulgatibacter sp.]|uniref:hypothetical protein n=1 Tax=Vulgatibacter sp. TaxID=1971226 RepID=UPI0035633F6C
MFAKTTGITLAVWGLLAAGAASAEAPPKTHADHGKHEHHDHGAPAGKLVLNAGAKWGTDAALRAGMEAFQHTLAEAIPAIHDGSFTPAQYAALAGNLEKQLASIMSQCKLPPEADAQLHILLVEFFGGIEAMKGEGDRMKGAVRIVRGLGTYGKFFEHPGWKPLVHG